MTSSLVVLRTSVLLMLLLATITGLYVRHVTRLSADAAAQSAASAAAQAATAAGWQCQTTPPPEAVTAAARAAWGQIDHLAVQPVAVEVSGRRLQPDHHGHRRAAGHPSVFAAHHRYRLSPRGPHRRAERARLVLRPTQ